VLIDIFKRLRIAVSMNQKAGGSAGLFYLSGFRGEPVHHAFTKQNDGTAYIAERRVSHFVVGAGNANIRRRYSLTSRFMISVAAAALIAGTGFANAQGTGMSREAPSAGATAQQSAPSTERAAPSSATPMNRNDASDTNAPAAKTTQSEEKMQPQGGKSQRAQEDMKAGPKGEKSAQDNNMKGEKSKSMSSETNTPAGKDMKAEGRNGNMNAETKGATDSRTQTTGQAGAGAKLRASSKPRSLR